MALLSGVDAFAAGAPSSAPQVLLAITNSESMDGTTSGAIMVGSGSLSSGYSSLTTSSSPTSYTIPSGFTPPVPGTAASGVAPWTVGCTSSGALDSSSSPAYQCDNGPSRLNMTKAAISNVLSSYGSTLNFGLYTYKTSSLSLYTTYVYYMSPSSGPFTFTNTAAASGAATRTVVNPCYSYSSSSSNVQSSCSSIAGQYGSGVVSGNQYMTIGASSDDPLINDVLYAGTLKASFITYGGANPANPYTHYTLSDYNTNIGGYTEGYSSTAPNIGGWSTTPTNAGYVPFSNQVMYSERGFGYGASQSATTGAALVPMSTDPTSSAFTTALQPETNDTSTKEIKSSAGQSGTYALLNGAKTYLAGLSTVTCQTQFVVLLTDGLPTLDKSGNTWPPLGTTTGTAYGLTASYNADGSFASSNSQAVTDAIAAITALNTAGIKTFVIGLGAGVDPSNNSAAAALLKAMAIAGGTTSAYAATDSASLSTAFLSVVDIIYRSSAVAAPVAPISVAGGTSSEYELTSIASPAAGHVQAFPVDANGVVTPTMSWDAGDASHMSPTTRGTALMSTSTTGSVVALGSVDAAAFSLTATTCVPNVATIVSYTIDPSYSGGPSGCSYLAGRQPNWPLGVFSTQDTGDFMGPPVSALLTARYPSYAGYARSMASRTPSVLFTNADGFLYSVNASATSGLLQWGWTSRSILAKMQNYSTFQSSGATDGSFSVVDAMNSGGAWGTYVVGSFQSGAEHFSLSLDATGAPSTVLYDTVVTGGTSSGDLAGATGSTPLRQPTIIAYIGNVAYEIYVVTLGGTSTLYERDVTSTAAASSAALATGFKVSSAISLDVASNRLWMGGTDGTVRFLKLTGVASTDVATLTTVGTTVTPSTGATLPNVLYAGYLEVNGIPYLYVENSSQVTVFGITTTGWAPLWASTPTQGYVYTSGAWATSSTVTKMTASAVVSDLPLQIGPGLLVPVYVPGTACTSGSGYYDLFNLADGTFPNNIIAVNSILVTADMYVGAGPAFTPSITAIKGGIALPTGSGGSTTPGTNPPTITGQAGPRAISWTQH